MTGRPARFYRPPRRGSSGDSPVMAGSQSLTDTLPARQGRSMATGRLGNIVFYADDPDALAAFWAQAFGYPQARFEGELKEHLLASGLTEADLAKRGLAE